MTKGNKEIGPRVLYLRTRAGLTQLEAAQKLGYKNRTSLAKIESGTSDIPISKIPIFCEVLRCSPLELLGLKDDGAPAASAQDLYSKVATLPAWKRKYIEKTIDALIKGMEASTNGNGNLE